METVPKLKRVTRIDSIPAGSTYFTEQGFLHDTPIVTSTGIFEYALPDGGVRRELRLPEHVFAKESLASYAGCPVIITHRAGSIDKDNVMDEIVGTILSEGFQDHEDVRCKIVIHDIDKVKAIPYRELSLGYNLDLIEEPGEWNGEPYDAIQTNIRINHLAIVESARAGEQAHLNLDGKKVEIDDKEIQEGGNEEMSNLVTHNDSIDMTAEELMEAIKMYRASKGTPVEAPVAEPEAEVKDGGFVEAEKKVVEAPVATPEVPAASQVEPTEPVAPVAEPEVEKKDTDGNAVVISKLEELLAILKGGSTAPQASVAEDNADGIGTPECAEDNADNEDSSDDLSKSMNNDSADDIFRQRLSICRVGDKLHMDGLEEKSLVDAKKAIINKVLPDMRLDGKDKAYIDAAYDMAVAAVNKRKDVDYQRQQMLGTSDTRADGADSNDGTMADSARRRMLEREGGNK